MLGPKNAWYLCQNSIGSPQLRVNVLVITGQSKVYMAKNGRKQIRKQKPQQKRKNRPTKSRRPKSRNPNRSSEPALQLSECAAKYALALADPWNSNAIGACVPAPPARGSRKVTTVTRGIVTIGVNGIGFIAVSPTLIGDFASIYYSNSAYLGTTINATNVVVAGVSKAAQLNIPYSKSQLTTENTTYFTTEVRGRIVSCAMSLKYIGTELNRGGRVMCYASPDHQSINALDTASMGARIESEFSTPGSSREKCWVVSYGIDESEFDYCEARPETAVTTAKIDRCYPLSSGEPLSSDALDAEYGAVIMGSLISGVAGNQFEFEVIQHLEYIGVLADAGLTESLADAQGLAQVQTAIGRTFRNRSREPNKPFKKVFKEELVKVGTEVGRAALIKGGTMLLSMLL